MAGLTDAQKTLLDTYARTAKDQSTNGLAHAIDTLWVCWQESKKALVATQELHVAESRRLLEQQRLAAEQRDAWQREAGKACVQRDEAERKVVDYEVLQRDLSKALVAYDQLQDEYQKSLEAIEGLQAHLVRAQEESARRFDVLRNLFVNHSKPASNGDWACAECRPQSDMIRKGFRCAYHEASALLRTPLEPQNG